MLSNWSPTADNIPDTLVVLLVVPLGIAASFKPAIFSLANSNSFTCNCSLSSYTLLSLSNVQWHYHVLAVVYRFLAKVLPAYYVFALSSLTF